MIDGWAMWLLLVGLAVGAAGAAVVLVRLPREEDDLGEMERRREAAWITATIERHGGIAPTSLVEEVLDLHRAYLVSPRAPAPVGASAPPLPPMPLAGAPPGAPLPGYGPGPGGAPPPGQASSPGGALPPGWASSPDGAPPPDYSPPAGYAPPQGYDPPPGRPGPPAPKG